MRILLITSYKRNMLSYLTKYEKLLKNANINYDILFWDRDKNYQLENHDNEYIFGKKCCFGGNKISKLNKILPYFTFRNNVKKLLKINSYDKIIVFNTLPALFLVDILLLKYKSNYIFDYRDYTYEKFYMYRKAVNAIVNNSYFTAISSKGFLKFLKNKRKLVQNHNISNLELKKSIVRLNGDLSKITIGFLGLVRYEDENKIIINSLKNSNRYILKYIGKMYDECRLQDYCEQENIVNVFFYGEFRNEDKGQLYNDIDIINAVYGNKTYEVRTALPNKLYDCLLLKKPMIVSNNTYLGSIVEKYNLGITIDLKKDNIIDRIEKYINKFNESVFMKNTEILLNVVLNDEKDFNKKFLKFIK